MTAKKISPETASNTSQTKARSKSVAKKGANPKAASSTASSVGKSTKKTVASKAKGSASGSLGTSSASAASKSRAIKAKAKTSASKPRRSRKKTILKNKPFIMALLTVLLLGGAGVYWLFSQAPSSSTLKVSEAPRKPDVPLPQVVPKTSGKPSVLAKPSSSQPATTSPNSLPSPILPKESSLPKESRAKPEVGQNSGATVEVSPSTTKSTTGTTGPSTTTGLTATLGTTGTTGTTGTKRGAISGTVRGATPNLTPKGGDSGDAAGEVYETTFGSLLEQSSKDIDTALVDLLKNKGFSSKNIKILEVERRSRSTGAYHFQKIRLELPDTSLYSKNPALFGQEFAAALPPLLVGAELASPSPRHYIVSVNGLVTHEILLMFYPPNRTKDGERVGPITPPPGLFGQAFLAIVIDDVGANLNAAKVLVGLDYPVTLAIWPRSEYASQSARLGHDKGLEIMIHQPMEPMEYPKNRPGPGAVFNRMSQAEISRVVSENISMVPYAVGLNNHMGSRFTQNEAGLEAVLGAIRGKNLFVLDSVTHGGTIFYDLAQEKGFAAQKRDIFLDVNHDKNAILYQLRKSERLAHSQGYAIAIGHPLPATLEALKEWQHSRDKSVKLVKVQDLIKYKRDNGQ